MLYHPWVEAIGCDLGFCLPCARKLFRPAFHPPANVIDQILTLKEPTCCGHCDYEEADGSLVAQCPTCKAKDRAAV